MNKITIVLTVFLALVLKSFSQIPNGDFESLNGWFLGNASLSTDHYPLSIGSYSLKLKDSLPLTSAASYGFVVSGNQSSGCIPSFPISGHPSAFCGYYKCIPLNNDTMQIAVELFNNGVWVAGAQLTTTDTFASWTSFNIPISYYTYADSATVTVAAFYNDTTCGFPAGPFGNSVLYADNLSFDTLVGSTTTKVSQVQFNNNSFNLFPNPASDFVCIKDNSKGAKCDFNADIYSIDGRLIKTIFIKGVEDKLDVSTLSNGVYSVNLVFSDSIIRKKLVVQH